MGTVLVLAIAVGVGVLVYRLTAGGEEGPATDRAPSGGAEDESSWTGDASPPPSRSDAPVPTGTATQPPPESRVPDGYIPVSGGGRSWHDRLGGAMGLVIAVAIGAIALAMSLWAVVVLVARLASSGGA